MNRRRGNGNGFAKISSRDSKKIREALKLKTGQKFRVFTLGQPIVLAPKEPIENLLGFVKGIDTHIRDENNRLRFIEMWKTSAASLEKRASEATPPTTNR